MGHLPNQVVKDTTTFSFPVTLLFLIIAILLTKLIKSTPPNSPTYPPPKPKPWGSAGCQGPPTAFCMNIKCRICVAGLKLEITSLTNQLWRFHIQGWYVCMCVSVRMHLFPRLQWQQRAPTHTHTSLILLRLGVLIHCLSGAKYKHPPHRHTHSTPSLHSAPLLPFKTGPRNSQKGY